MNAPGQAPTRRPEEDAVLIAPTEPGAPAASAGGVARQITVRAVVAGMTIGSVLALCNIYSGLKIGWGSNMSITAALIAFGLFAGSARLFGTRPFGILENNINQTAASAAAYVSSAGLVSAIPALTLLTGKTLSWPLLSLWSFAVCAVGITVAIGLRRQMLIVDALPFANGIAAAQTLREMYARGRDALNGVLALVGGATVAAVVKWIESFFKLPKFAPPGGVSGASFKNLTFALDPTLLMFGVGAIVGFRTGASLLLGAIVAWLVLAPEAIARGWATAGAPGGVWFGSLVTWLLWPGVALMVTSSLTSFAFSWRSLAATMGLGRKKAEVTAEGAPLTAEDTGEVSRPWFWRALLGSALLAILLQVVLFDISVGIATFGVLITFALAVVAGRVSGETAITPVGPMGKVTQLIFGIVAPGAPAANLMAANVTGGAASQCGDLLHDMKAGQLLGAKARLQAIAQVFGVIAGAMVGSAAYLLLITDPQKQLLSAEWPAPAVAQWKAVAELFMKGFEAMPAGATGAMIVAGSVGVVLAVCEKVLPGHAAKWVPSPSAVGLAFVIPAWNSVSFFLGAVAGLIVARLFKSWAARFVVIIASGIIAGEGLMGVGIAIEQIISP